MSSYYRAVTSGSHVHFSCRKGFSGISTYAPGIVAQIDTAPTLPLEILRFADED